MTKFATVTADGLNVRANPHSTSKVVATLKKGDRREIVGRDESTPGYLWLKVKEGWVYSKYVTVASNVPDFEPPEIMIPDTSLAKLVAAVIGVIVLCAMLAWAVK